ncbi:MAG TPA: hypothetical protein VJH68_03910 [Candidatus Nanoarchaeia archaeon]|nr:hypothetical protein [Candidatus Nanoarchaeia archaeon]
MKNIPAPNGPRQKVLALNGGYLCNHHIARILNAKKSKNLAKDAQELANSFLSAGLLIPKE